MPQTADSRSSQLRLLLEELLCDLCLFDHTANGCPPEHVRVDREYPLGPAGAFADIRVSAPDSEPYFVEVKHGYPPEKLVAHLNRKYAHPEVLCDDTRRLILVLDNAQAAV